MSHLKWYAERKLQEGVGTKGLLAWGRCTSMVVGVFAHKDRHQYWKLGLIGILAWDHMAVIMAGRLYKCQHYLLNLMLPSKTSKYQSC